MKYILSFLLLISFTATVSHAQEPNVHAADITFKEKKIDIGKIKDKKERTINFEYKNTGNAPLVITHVDVSCGCIKPTWSKQPLAPDQSGTISVAFDPRTKYGYTLLSLYVKSNAASGLQIVRIQADIK